MEWTAREVAGRNVACGTRRLIGMDAARVAATLRDAGHLAHADGHFVITVAGPRTVEEAARAVAQMDTIWIRA